MSFFSRDNCDYDPFFDFNGDGKLDDVEEAIMWDELCGSDLRREEESEQNDFDDENDCDFD